jgi:hypothetical protein
MKSKAGSHGERFFSPWAFCTDAKPPQRIETRIRRGCQFTAAPEFVRAVNGVFNGTKPNKRLESVRGAVRVAQRPSFKPCGFSMFVPSPVGTASVFSRRGLFARKRTAHDELNGEFVQATRSRRWRGCNGVSVKRLFNGTKPIYVENK